MSLIAEFRQRKLVQWAVAYVAAAFALLQGIDIVAQRFAWPDAIERGLIIAVCIGFFVTLLLAWYHGERGAQRVTGTELLILALLLSLGGGFFWRFASAAREPAVTSAVSAVRANSPALPVAIPEKSIAVLPFENLSAEKDNAYFADGIQDEILTGLAKIGDLKVISRTSTERYASKPGDISDIARQLGVANILEGSVQRAGDRVRVNVQLIAADSDSHLWAETYDRKLDDVFAVQSEIAQRIASSLRAKLTRDERVTLTTRPTTDTAAYDAYLRGVALDAQGFELAIARKAAMAYAGAVRLDPAFALAWAHLAEQASYLYFNGVDPQTWTADYVKRAADTAFRLQPELAEAQLAQGYYRYRVLRDFGGAAQAFAAVVRKAPNNIQALQYLGFAERREGKWQQALAHLEQAAERDPRNPGLMTTIGGETLLNMRRYDEARVRLNRALAMAPGSSLATFYKAMSYLYQGRIEHASGVLDPLPQAGEDPQIAWVRSYQRLLQRHYDTAIAELQPLLAQPADTLNGWAPQLAINLGYAQRWHGDTAQARATFENLIGEIGPQGANQVDDSVLPIVLAQAYAALDEHKLALAQAQHAVDLYRNDAIYRPQAEWTLAQVQAMSGDHTAAIAGLAQSLQEPAGLTLAQLQLDPTWDPLRKDPRFQKLIADGAAAKARDQVKP